MSLRLALQDAAFRRKVQEAFSNKVVIQVLRLSREDTLKPVDSKLEPHQRLSLNDTLNGRRLELDLLLGLSADAPVVSAEDDPDYAARERLREIGWTDERIDDVIAAAKKETE